jgi:hypothetical protein
VGVVVVAACLVVRVSGDKPSWPDQPKGTPTSNGKKSSYWAPRVVKVTSPYRSEDLPEFTVLKKEVSKGRDGGDNLYLDVIVREETPRQSVLYLAEDFRKKYVGKYAGAVVIGIWDSERGFREFRDLPEDDAYLHFLAEVQFYGTKDQGQIIWSGKGRTH